MYVGTEMAIEKHFNASQRRKSVALQESALVEQPSCVMKSSLLYNLVTNICIVLQR